MRKLNFFIILYLCICIFNAYAQAPQLINYQGKLLTDGKPTEGPVDITFAMYPAASGGTALWTETQSAVPLSNGMFNVLLGSITAFQPDIFTTSGERWLGIKVGQDAEMMPRFRLSSVAYAIHSAHSDTAEFAKTAVTTSTGNTLDQAYDQGGAGVGRTITADAGAVYIAGSSGLTVAGNVSGTSNLIVDGKIGVGIDNPTYKVDVSGTVFSDQRIMADNSGQSGYLSRIMLFGEGRAMARLVFLCVNQGGLAELDLA